MLDSADTADDAEPGDAACPCGGETFNAAVGFTLGDDVRWVYVALGVYTDWKIDYSPTAHLLDRA